MIVFYTGNVIQKPGDMMIVYGDGLDRVVKAEFSRLSDGSAGDAPAYVAASTPVSTPDAETLAGAVCPRTGEERVEADLIQPCRESIKLVVPETLEEGVYALTLTADDGDILTLYVNAPYVRWAQGDEGSKAVPGGAVRLFGEKLAMPGKPVRVTALVNGQYIPLAVARIYDACSVEATLPEDTPCGEVKLFLHNGFGDETAWSMPVRLTVAEGDKEPDEHISVLDFGADRLGVNDATAAFRAAMALAGERGGAVIDVPRGRYRLSDSLRIPPHCVLRGESNRCTQLFWTAQQWELGQIPPVLIDIDTDVTIEDLDLRGTRVETLIQGGLDNPDAKNIHLHRVRANFNAFAGGKRHISNMKGRLEIYQEFDMHWPKAMIRLAGENIQITDGDFYNAYMTFGDTHQRSKTNFVFRNNHVRERFAGWAYFVHIENGILEDNEFEGCTVGFGGANNYMARNCIHDVLNNDREAFTTDMSYSTASAHPVSVCGTRLTFDENVVFKLDRVRSGGVYVNGGKGRGQARRIVRLEGNVLELDQPFAVDPDKGSELCVGGTFRTAYYLMNNRIDNAGHIQFYCDQCSSIYEGNVMTRSAGLMIYSWQDKKAEQKPGEMRTFTRTENAFVSIVGNRCSDGCYFHKDGEIMQGTEDGWSGFSSIGLTMGGDRSSSTGTLIRGNELSDNAFLQIRPYSRAMVRCMVDAEGDYIPVATDIVVEKNTVSGSFEGFSLKGFDPACRQGPDRLVIRKNDFSQNVDRPVVIPEFIREHADLIAE